MTSRWLVFLFNLRRKLAIGKRRALARTDLEAVDVSFSARPTTVQLSEILLIFHASGPELLFSAHLWLGCCVDDRYAGSCSGSLRSACNQHRKVFCREKNVFIWLAVACDRHSRETLANNGFSELLETVLSRIQVCVKKPHPDKNANTVLHCVANDD